MIFKEFADHKQQLQDFVEGAVHLILQRLNEQGDHEVRCLYSNEVLETALLELLIPLSDRYTLDAKAVAAEFANVHLENIIEACRTDAQRYMTEDPALENLEEIFYASNGFWATVAYRIAHELRNLGVPIIPRAISGFAHSRTGFDIHPGAKIGPGLFIDHGTGIAIGCTAVLHNDINLYNGVVLGTKSKPSKNQNDDTGGVEKRHPTIESGVSLYTNAFVGGDITVGEKAIIGAYAFVTNDVPAGTSVSGKEKTNIPVGGVLNVTDQLQQDKQTRNASRPAVLQMMVTHLSLKFATCMTTHE